ncbi:MAG: hypothetical protein ACFB4J_17120, partial [Elainellaceae cyanobacterium]
MVLKFRQIDRRSRSRLWPRRVQQVLCCGLMGLLLALGLSLQPGEAQIPVEKLRQLDPAAETVESEGSASDESGAEAEEDAAAEASESEDATDLVRAPVTLDGRKLFTVAAADGEAAWDRAER